MPLTPAPPSLSAALAARQALVLKKEIALAALRGAGQGAGWAGEGAAQARVLRMGDMAIGARFPEGGLRRGAVHEAAPLTHWDHGAALGFCLGAGVRALQDKAGSMVWITGPCGDFGAPYGLGLAGFGLDPRRMLLVSPPRVADRLWAVEEAARSGAAALVLAQLEGDRLDLLASRRLQLAAESGGSLVLLLRAPSDAPIASVYSRWRVSARFGAAAGKTIWRMNLLRARNLPAGGAAFDVEWRRATGAFHLAAILGDTAAGSAGTPRQAGASLTRALGAA